MAAFLNRARVRALLAERRATVRDLAAATGANYTHLADVIRGTRPASEQVMTAVAGYLGVPVDELLGDDTALERHIRELVAAAPPLPPDAVGRIVAILVRRPATTSAA